VDAETVAEIKIFDSRSGIQKSGCGTLRILGYVRKLVRSAGAIADAATPASELHRCPALAACGLTRRRLPQRWACFPLPTLRGAN
jgi:hypothetical protein